MQHRLTNLELQESVRVVTPHDPKEWPLGEFTGGPTVS